MKMPPPPPLQSTLRCQRDSRNVEVLAIPEPGGDGAFRVQGRGETYNLSLPEAKLGDHVVFMQGSRGQPPCRRGEQGIQ